MNAVQDISSLVKEPKCPTRPYWALEHDHDPITAPGTRAVIYRRAHTDEWLIRCEVEPPALMRPPLQGGDRMTTSLSQRGKREISDSCEYVYLE